MGKLKINARVVLRAPGLEETGVFGTITKEGLDFLVRLVAVYVQWDDGTSGRYAPWEVELVGDDCACAGGGLTLADLWAQRQSAVGK